MPVHEGCTAQQTTQDEEVIEKACDAESEGWSRWVGVSGRAVSAAAAGKAAGDGRCRLACRREAFKVDVTDRRRSRNVVT